MENTVEIIKTYEGALGTITVTRYCENGYEEYHVKHSNPALVFCGEWTKDKSYAIAKAQFLAGKY